MYCPSTQYIFSCVICQVPTPSYNKNIQDSARKGTKWCFYRNKSCVFLDKLDTSDCRTKKRQVIANQVQGSLYTKSGPGNYGQRKLATGMLKTASPLLCSSSQERTVRYQQSNNNGTFEKRTRTNQQKLSRMIESKSNKKEKVPLDIKSKVFQLAHGLIKTPNLRRSYDRDITISEELKFPNDSDEESGHPNSQNNILSALDMYQEARKASKGSEEATALFRLAIERQRRLSITPNKYSLWALKAGIRTTSNTEDIIINDKINYGDSTGGVKTRGLPDIAIVKSSRKPDIQIENPSDEQSSTSTIPIMSLGQNERDSRDLTNSIDFQNIKMINDDYHSGLQGTLRKKNELRTHTYSGETKNISQVQKTVNESQHDRGHENEDRDPDILSNCIIIRFDQIKQTANGNLSTLLKDEESELSTCNRENNIQRKTSRLDFITQPNITPKVLPLDPTSEEAVCQNLPVSTVDEHKEAEEVTDILNSEDTDEITEDLPDKLDASKRKVENVGHKKDLKHELEKISGKLQVSSSDTKKISSKTYVKPHLRHKTEKMYLLKRKNLLYRDIALALRQRPDSETLLLGRDQRLNLQVSYNCVTCSGT